MSAVMLDVFAHLIIVEHETGLQKHPQALGPDGKRFKKRKNTHADAPMNFHLCIMTLEGEPLLRSSAPKLQSISLQFSILS